MSGRPKMWQEPFLAAMRELPIVSHAAKLVGIDRTTAYYERKNNPDFAAAWDDAVEEGVDKVEAAAFQRATQGWDDPVFHMGEVVGYRKLYSDRLAELVLKGRRKSIYVDRSEVTQNLSGGVTIITGVPAAKREG